MLSSKSEQDKGADDAQDFDFIAHKAFCHLWTDGVFVSDVNVNNLNVAPCFLIQSVYLQRNI